MVFSFKTVCVAIALLSSSAHAFSTGAGGCSGGQAAVMDFHLSTNSGKVATTGSLADGGIGLRLDGIPLDPLDASAATAHNFSATDIHVLNVAGASDYRGILVRLSAPTGVNTTSSLLEVSGDLQDADTCVAPVVGITHTNSNLKNTQFMSLFLPSGGEVTLDVTVVVANNSTDSIYYYSGYTLNAVTEDAGAVVNPVCDVCGAGVTISKPDAIVYNPLTMTEVTCAEVEAGGQLGVISPVYCSALPGFIANACGCEVVSQTGGDDVDAVDADPADETTSSPTTAPLSAAAGQHLVVVAVFGVVAAVTLA